ncbi:MAG: PEP-CTERM sorting domain-containing protein [Verrucomicrobiota bacterium]
MKINQFLLLTILAIGSASAQISITISPIAGDTESYLLQASGSGGVADSTIDSGDLFLSGAAFSNNNEFPAAGLSYGGQSVVEATPSGPAAYFFELSDFLSSGTAYSFSGGSTIVALGSGNSYLGLFTPGVYAITTSTGIFGDDATGSLEILSTPIPEPSTYAILFGLLSILLTVAKRRRKYRIADGLAGGLGKIKSYR